MQFKLTRQVTSKELNRLIAREVRSQQVLLPRASAKVLRQVADVSREIEKNRVPEHLVLRKLPENLGYGIFLHPKAKPIQKGELIGPYSGILSLEPQHDQDDSSYAFAPLADINLSKEEQKQFDAKRRFSPRRLYILNLDAAKKGNFTRYINHSDKPNVEAQYLSVPKNHYGIEPMPLEVFYFAKKMIRPGEQLLVSYEDGDEKSYWGACGIEPYPMTPKTFTLSKSLKVTKKSL